MYPCERGRENTGESGKQRKEEKKRKEKKKKRRGENPTIRSLKDLCASVDHGPVEEFCQCHLHGHWQYHISSQQSLHSHVLLCIFSSSVRLSLLARRGSCSGPLYSHLPVPVREYPAPITWMRRDGSVGTDSTPPMAKLSKTAQLSGWLARGGGFFPQLQVAVILRRNDNNNNNAVAIRQGGFPAFFLITSSVFPGEW